MGQKTTKIAETDPDLVDDFPELAAVRDGELDVIEATLALVWMRCWEAGAKAKKVWQSLGRRLGEGSSWWDNNPEKKGPT